MTAAQHFQPGTQLHAFWQSHDKIAAQNQALLDLLFGPNAITDDELKRLIAKHPHLRRFNSYIGKRVFVAQPVIKNDQTKRGQPATTSVYFGTGNSPRRYYVYAMHSRFSAVEYRVVDTEHKSGKPTIIRQAEDLSRALYGTAIGPFKLREIAAWSK